MALVTLGAPQLVEAGGDAVWSPGETATIRVLLTNEGVDNFFYPGVAVTSDVAGVTSSGNTLFGLFQGQAVELDVQAQADAGLAAGTAVNLTLTVSTLNETCQGLDQALFSATLE